MRPGLGQREGQREEQECFYGSSGREPACLQLAREHLICSFLTAPHLWAEGQGGVRLGQQLDVLGGTGRAEAVRAWVRQPPGISKEISKQFGGTGFACGLHLGPASLLSQPWKTRKSPLLGETSHFLEASPLASMAKEVSDLVPGTPFILGQTLPLS